MRSLSTSALGQPSETMPIAGWPGRRVSLMRGAGAMSGRREGGFWLIPAL